MNCQHQTKTYNNKFLLLKSKIVEPKFSKIKFKLVEPTSAPLNSLIPLNFVYPYFCVDKYASTRTHIRTVRSNYNIVTDTDTHHTIINTHIHTVSKFIQIIAVQNNAINLILKVH